MMGTFTGNPNQFDGKNPWVPVKIFPLFASQAAGIYSEDFQLLGYDPRRPEQQDPLHPSERW
jgi:hypothetical protein